MKIWYLCSDVQSSINWSTTLVRVEIHRWLLPGQDRCICCSWQVNTFDWRGAPNQSTCFFLLAWCSIHWFCQRGNPSWWKKSGSVCPMLLTIQWRFEKNRYAGDCHRRSTNGCSMYWCILECICSSNIPLVATTTTTRTTRTTKTTNVCFFKWGGEWWRVGGEWVASGSS